jgi:hypothetical protein
MTLFLQNPNRSKKFLVFISALPLLLSLALPVSCGADSSLDISKISVNEVKQSLGKPDMVIIDVRRTQNWWRSSNKILTANRENPSRVSQWAGKYAKDKTLVFYCA